MIPINLMIPLHPLTATTATLHPCSPEHNSNSKRAPASTGRHTGQNQNAPAQILPWLAGAVGARSGQTTA